ncbi:glycosyltransferase 87 family protein [Streptomyces sp. H27-C3]|uniref:glycosyltransferase 87 family protein n=1 Tax=Streptomyces sp. H27-C3 TaxID=3046305 RepID=UPI0024B9D916|nr:glycosyltransferase 87 family protein [Streptomyces sp. H27-C3]MDJ0464873.1 glycosyltransferase 87 family protein [Streptomyces sp. H27-C3]
MSPRSTAVSGIALVVSLVALTALCLVQHIPMADTLVYRAEGAAVANGTDLYGFTVTEWQLPATYPPFAAILFVPTTWLPLGALKVVFAVGNAALLALLVHLSCRFARLPARPALVLAGTAVGLWLEPVFQTILFGQINLVLVCLVLWDLSRTDDAIGKGFGLGIAAGVKLTPAIFIVYLLLTGRVRAGLTALASFIGTVLLGALVLPTASIDFWTRRIFETGRVGKAWIVDNQSLQGLLARVLHTEEPGAVWLAAAVLTGVAGLWIARRAAVGAGCETWGVLATAATALLVSPISWSHHWVWCVPLIAVLIAEGRGRIAAAVAAVFLGRSLWLVPHQGELDLRLAWWQQVPASPYALVACALLAYAAWRLRTGRAVPAADLPSPRTAPKAAPLSRTPGTGRND